MIFNGVSPALRATRIPRSTLSKLPGTRVIRSNVGASTASMLTVARCNPAAFSGQQALQQMAIRREREIKWFSG